MTTIPDNGSAGTIAISEVELAHIVFLREFKEWLTGLSGPARRNIERLPGDMQMSLARVIVNKRLNRLGEHGIWVSGEAQPTNVIPFKIA